MKNELEPVRDPITGKVIALRNPARVELTRRMAEGNRVRQPFRVAIAPPPPAPPLAVRDTNTDTGSK